MKTYIKIILNVVFISVVIFSGCSVTQKEEKLPEIHGKLTKAPNVPPPTNRDYPAKVIIEMEVVELVGKLADGVEYTFWTFGGSVPGEFIRIREGDEVEFHLKNHPSSKLPHNIDLHAVTGPGGGAEASFTTPGHSSTFNFKALNAGLYVYHCATAPVGLHIANGMYGLILVEPAEGLPKVSREYYVMQSEFYTEGKYGQEGYQPFSMEKALDENPDYVVFNGSVGSLVGDKALRANVGETVRLFVGNGGPNLISSFHVIGEIFDVVYSEGGTAIKQENVQTTLVPAGGSAIVEFKLDVPGEFILVDHSIFRAFNKGAIGKLEVGGKENESIYSGKVGEEVYSGKNESNGAINSSTGRYYQKTDEEKYVPQFTESNEINYSELNKTAGKGKRTENKKEDLVSLGKQIFASNCFACHQADGSGLPNVFPPVKNSDWIAKKSKEEFIDIVLGGLNGKIKVNGKNYNNIMPPQNLNDRQIAAVLTYVYKEMNNSKKTVSEAEVKKYRNTKNISGN